MVDNRYATALVIACVLSMLASVYLSVAIGTHHWYQYTSPAVRGEANASELRSLYEEFIDGEFDEKTYSDTLFRLNGTVSLWWRCVLVPSSAQWYKEPGTCAKTSDASPVGSFQAFRQAIFSSSSSSMERGHQVLVTTSHRLMCAVLRMAGRFKRIRFELEIVRFQGKIWEC